MTGRVAHGRRGDESVLRASAAGVRLDVRVIPRASRSMVTGVREDRLVVRVTAPPAEGAANAAVCRLLARAFRVAPGTVAVVGGASARNKTIEIRSLTLDEAGHRLSAILA